MKRRKIFYILTVILLIATFFGGCSGGSGNGDSGSGKSDSEVYKFALLAPLTGNNAQYGITYRNTLQILADKVNSQGGINGKKIELEVYDDKNDPKESVNIASKIAASKDIIGVIGSQTSSCSMAAAPILQEAGIPMISPQASHPDFTKGGEYIFTAQVTLAYENLKAAEYLVNKLGAKKVAIIYSNDDWGVSMYDTLSSALKEYPGVEVVAAETYITNETKDFTSLISKIKQVNPDALFLASLYSDGGQIIQQAKGLDLNVPYVGSNTFFKEEFIEVFGDDVEGVTLTNTIELETDNEEYLWLSEEYHKVTGAFIDTYVTQSYDSLNLLLGAVEKVGDDKEKIKEELQNLKNYVGVSGTFTFDENRTPAKEVFIYEIKDGEIVQLDSLS